MFATLKTLMVGASARAEDNVRNVYAVELIDQKIREAGDALKGAKLSLASLIQRQRAEARQIAQLKSRIADLMARAGDALAAGRNDLAQEAATAVAEMENELASREQTEARLETRCLQLRASIEAAHRRLVDLKQGAIAARALRREQSAQRSLTRAGTGASSMSEAEELIAQVMGQDDPFEHSQILEDIDANLTGTDIEDRLAREGFGLGRKVTKDDVLARLAK
ncbi:PspA/IM30 family protein [Roseobacteraceae bacterium S113]